MEETTLCSVINDIVLNVDHWGQNRNIMTSWSVFNFVHRPKIFRLHSERSEKKPESTYKTT